jgi:hypothetical protein
MKDLEVNQKNIKKIDQGNYKLFNYLDLMTNIKTVKNLKENDLNLDENHIDPDLDQSLKNHYLKLK